MLPVADGEAFAGLGRRDDRARCREIGEDLDASPAPVGERGDADGGVSEDREVFSLPSGWSGDAARVSAENLIPEDAEELVLARRVWADGRTRAYVCGRSATVADSALREGAGRSGDPGRETDRRTRPLRGSGRS